MIAASGLRNIPDLFKLVPGMYVSYYKGSQAIVSYHGLTDQYSRRMQVMIDGRSVYMSPNNTVDWANLPITIEDILRIEVIRGPAAASYGANSTQGVINIITRDASEIDGKILKIAHGNKGVNDESAYFGKRGEQFDYRMTLGYTADNGYDNLGTPPNNIKSPEIRLTNNSYDNNQARLVNYRGNYHPDGKDSFDVQIGFNHDVQEVGFVDKNPTSTNPASTNSNPPHNLVANTNFLQLGWNRQLENSSELNLKYYHIQEDQQEVLPVYLHGIYCPGPIGNSGYCPGPVAQNLSVGRDLIEVQHTLSTSESNRLVYGANYQRNLVNGQSSIPPLSLLFSSSIVIENYQIFANDEWRINPNLLLNIGAMIERDDIGHNIQSPRVALNFHLTPQHTFRTGISVAYRTPALTETNFPMIAPGVPGAPGVLIIPNATIGSPGLVPEKLVSHEIGYIGEFPDWKTSLDLRLFMDQFGNGIVLNTAKNAFRNGLSAEYRGFEATLKKSWGETSHLTFNFAHDFASSNSSSFPSISSSAPWTTDSLAASIPKNSSSAQYSLRFLDNFSVSTSYYYQDFLQPFDRGNIDFQPSQHRVDIRIARNFQDVAGLKGEVALVVQNVFSTDYTEYSASNLFNQREYVTMKLNW
jgi:iron complex outermembrane receptor protein